MTRILINEINDEIRSLCELVLILQTFIDKCKDNETHGLMYRACHCFLMQVEHHRDFLCDIRDELCKNDLRSSEDN
jgi:hypothetical protein